MKSQQVFILTCFRTRIPRSTVSKLQECECSDSNARCDWLDDDHMASAYMDSVLCAHPIHVQLTYNYVTVQLFMLLLFNTSCLILEKAFVK